MNIRIQTAPKLWFVPISTNMKKRTLRQRVRQWKKNNKKKRYVLNGQMPIW
ncbi:hypothetical protein ACFLZH_01345 [Patescibacteria group bacterium]